MSKQRGSRVGALLTPEILDAISEIFPREALKLNASVAEVWHKEGQCSVVDILRAKHKEVNKNILNKELL